MLQKVAVFGLGRFGASVATTLHAEGVEVLAVDRSRNLVDAIKNEVTTAVSFDATDLANLRHFGVHEMDAVVVGIGDNFEASVMITLHCRTLGVPRIIGKALSASQRQVLELVGATEVIQPEERMGRWIAENLVHDSVINLVELPEGFLLMRIRLPEAWEEKTIGELALMKEKRLSLVQVHRHGEGAQERLPLPDGEFRLQAGDELDVIGPEKNLVSYEAVGRGDKLL